MVGEKKPIVEGYPTTGPGIITVADYPGETFLNPNTFNPYEATDEDGWIGNFSIDNTGEIDENGNLVSQGTETRGTHNLKPKNQSMLTMCFDYAKREVEDNSGGGSGTKSNNSEKGTWTDSLRTPNLLYKYSDWNQQSPFNDLYPYRRKYLLFGHKRKVPAGCFPLALTKVISYFRYPHTITFNGKRIDWDAVDHQFNANHASSIAALCYSISLGCSSWYFYSGTFTFPAKVESFMRNYMYNNVKRLNYTFDRVTSMIDNGCPVPMYGMPGISIWNSHAWIIDGYKIKKRKIKGDASNEVCRMVHCDFGWSGNHNGYYVDGIFRASTLNDYDNSNDKGLEKKFNRHLRIIMYSNPNINNQ